MSDLQDTILDAALPLIVFEGWTPRTIANAAQTCGLPAIDGERAFPGGISEALAYWSHRADARMLHTLETEYTLSEMKIRERIATAVLVRLRQNEQHREAVRRAVAHLALPWNIALATRLLYDTVDTMWRAAGDRSTDYNFYTKRALLAKVYSLTLTIWLNDDSKDLSETQAFLYRRIENVMQIEKAKAFIRQKLRPATPHTT